RSRYNKIGVTINFLHPMVESGDKSRNIFAAIIIRNQTPIAPTGEMDDLERDILQCGQRFDDGLVDPTRALASAHHAQRREVFAQAQSWTRNMSLQASELG